MLTKFEITIECGFNTCASEPGKFCDWVCLHTKECTLFGKLEEEDGWIKRHPKCIITKYLTEIK